MENDQRGHADTIKAHYDPIWKFPVSIWIDFLTSISDDERCYEVSSFELPPFH